MKKQIIQSRITVIAITIIFTTIPFVIGISDQFQRITPNHPGIMHPQLGDMSSSAIGTMSLGKEFTRDLASSMVDIRDSTTLDSPMTSTKVLLSIQTDAQEWHAGSEYTVNFTAQLQKKSFLTKRVRIDSIKIHLIVVVSEPAKSLTIQGPYPLEKVGSSMTVVFNFPLDAEFYGLPKQSSLRSQGRIICNVVHTEEFRSQYLGWDELGGELTWPSDLLITLINSPAPAVVEELSRFKIIFVLIPSINLLFLFWKRRKHPTTAVAVFRI